MGAVVLRGISKRFGATEVLRDVDLEIPDGALVVVVGPSGCGKSTLLRLVAGLEEASEGAIEIAGRDVTHLPPAERRIAMVFQSYALYPHMSVYDNMAFGLKLARHDKAQIRERIEDAARLLQIGHLLARKPRELSGGQRQRVAMGRALVREPAVFLFDEPLSNLDAALRVGMRLEIARLQRQLGATMLYVTHDQTEAMTLAQTIVVMRDGRIEQVGAPLELYRRPRNLFVAGFLGTPKMNVLPAAVAAADAGGLVLQVEGGFSLVLPPVRGLRPGERLHLGLRPEHLRLGDPGAAQAQGEAAFPGVVSHVEHLGAESHVYLDVAGERLTVSARGAAPVAPGDAAAILFSPTDCHLFAEDGEAIRGPDAATAAA
ncbi:MAG TPA: sn-glycerol-3-phosphate ABC transporter ATP-binding protein UgpC, partial [Rhodospirillales bacterium]|nr:sn-glycerol-3-phosphate ABC transporter ATP-binding protein UgpC [Rhodospirillales bacterium]